MKKIILLSFLLIFFVGCYEQPPLSDFQATAGFSEIVKYLEKSTSVSEVERRLESIIVDNNRLSKKNIDLLMKEVQEKKRISKRTLKQVLEMTKKEV